jgi:hypothetical protein
MRLWPSLSVSVVLALACGGQAPISVPIGTATTKAPVKPAPRGADAEAAKLECLIEECVNRFSPRAFDSRDRYFSWVDVGEGPTGRERNIYGVYTFPLDARKCQWAIENVQRMTPPMPGAEQAGAGYAEALLALDATLAKADRYYDKQRYKLDDMAEGKQLHEVLVTEFEVFGLADARLVLALDAELDKLDQTLPDLVATPTTDGYVRTTGVLAKRASRLAFQAQPDENGRLRVPNLPAFETAVRDYDAVLRRFEGFADQTHDARARAFIEAAGDLEDALASCLDLLKKAAPMSSSEIRRMGTFGGWMTRGSPDDVVKKYGEVVEEHNELIHPHQIMPTRRKLGRGH